MKYLSKIILLCIFSLFSFVSLTAQNAMTMLLFEDAEQAFNRGDYKETLKKVEEVEAKTGVTSKTLYLKIVAQDNILEKTLSPNREMERKLVANVNKYLEALKNLEIDDKYRTVYKISERIKSNAYENLSVEEQIKDFLSPIKDSKVKGVIVNYWRAVLGEVNTNKIKTVQTDFEYFREGESTPFETKKSVKSINRFYWKYQTNRFSNWPNYYNETKYINGKGTYLFAKVPTQPQQRDLTSEEVKLYQETSKGGINFLDGRSIFLPGFTTEQLAAATYEKGDFEGDPAAIIKVFYSKESRKDGCSITQHYYFSLKTGLLLGDEIVKESNLLFSQVRISFRDYTNVMGITLAFTRKNEYVFSKLKDPENWNKRYQSASKRERKKMDEELAIEKQKINPENGEDEIYISKLKSIKINEPIPEGLFE